jgi:hypothetical protein
MATLTRGLGFNMPGKGGFGLKPAIAQPENVIEPIENHFVMRDADDRSFLINGDPAQQVHHDPGALRIERRGRLIGQNDARPIGKRARDRDTLRLAAGQLRRHCMPAVTDLQVVQ